MKQNVYKFKFGLGATVRHLACGEPVGPKEVFNSWDRIREQRWFIVERRLQECPGGIQRHYVCRSVSRDGGISSATMIILEQELQVSEPFKIIK